jgi:hypothetical protein
MPASAKVGLNSLSETICLPRPALSDFLLPSSRQQKTSIEAAMLKKLALVVSASLIGISTAQAQNADSDKEVAAIEDTIDEIQMEATQCWAYFEFVKHCSENSKRPDVAKGAEDSRNSAMKVAFLYGTTRHMTADAMTSRFKMAMDEQKELMANSCVNLASLYVRYGKSCKELIEHPDVAYKERICARAKGSDYCQVLRAMGDSRSPRH